MPGRVAVMEITYPQGTVAVVEAVAVAGEAEAVAVAVVAVVEAVEAEAVEAEAAEAEAVAVEAAVEAVEVLLGRKLSWVGLHGKITRHATVLSPAAR